MSKREHSYTLTLAAVRAELGGASMHTKGSPPPSISQIARVYFVQVLLLGTGVPGMTQPQPLYLELHRLHEPILVLDVMG